MIKKTEGLQRSSGWVTGVMVYIVDDTAKAVRVTRIAHRREVYE
jgi:hypothetical protein